MDHVKAILQNGLDENSLRFYKITDKEKFIQEQWEKVHIFTKNLKIIKQYLMGKGLNRDETMVLLEYAGFGDTIHTKLLIQHLQRQFKNIIWITLESIKDLYREHTELLIYPNNLNNNLRHPSYKICTTFMSIIEKIFMELFVKYKNKVDLSANITRLHRQSRKVFNEYYFDACGIKRDFNIKHEIKHTGSYEGEFKRKVIGFEHCSMSFKSLENMKAYQNIVNILNKKYDIVLFGSLNDPKLDGCALDWRGKSFYDTFSIIKKIDMFIGRNSANQTLMAYRPNIQIIEIDTVRDDMSTCKYLEKKIIRAATRIQGYDNFFKCL